MYFYFPICFLCVQPQNMFLYDGLSAEAADREGHG